MLSGANRGGVGATEAALLGYVDAVIGELEKVVKADEASAPEGAAPAAEPVPAPQAVGSPAEGHWGPAELPDLPGIPDDTEYSDDLPYGHPDDETGAAEEGFGLEGSWTTNPAALEQATLRARAVRQLEVGATLEAELRCIRREVRHDQRMGRLMRELRMQRKQVQGLVAVLTLMTNDAESKAAAVHCTDLEDSEWLARWADADPWGRQLVSHARCELGRARS